MKVSQSEILATIEKQIVCKLSLMLTEDSHDTNSVLLLPTLLYKEVKGNIV